MADRGQGWLHRWRRRRAARDWAALARSAPTLGAGPLGDLRDEARALKRDLDRLLIEADRARNPFHGAGTEAVPVPPGTDWRWRPTLFEGVLPSGGVAAPDSGLRYGPDAVVWHDLPDAALIVGQTDNQRLWNLPAHALQLECFAPGEGGYVALSFDLPAPVMAGLDQGHVLRVASVTGAERPADLYLRLNIEHGPNTEQMLRHLDGGGAGNAVDLVTEFDLGFVEMNPNRLQKIWLDVILERPGYNAIWLRDLVVSRHRRADI